MMFGYGYDGFSLLWMGLMMFFMVAGTIGVVLLIAWLIRGPSGYYEGRPLAQDEALAVASRRYAAGEITKEQYDEIVKTLRR